MWGAMDNNTRSFYEIVEEILKGAITNPGQWNFDQFIETDAWKLIKIINVFTVL